MCMRASRWVSIYFSGLSSTLIYTTCTFKCGRNLADQADLHKPSQGRKYGINVLKSRHAWTVLIRSLQRSLQLALIYIYTHTHTDTASKGSYTNSLSLSLSLSPRFLLSRYQSLFLTLILCIRPPPPPLLHHRSVSLPVFHTMLSHRPHFEF